MELTSHRALLLCLCALALGLTPTAAVAQGSPAASRVVKMPNFDLDFGELRGGERSCLRTGLGRAWQIPQDWQVAMPTGVRLQCLGWDAFPRDCSEQFCVKAAPWAPSHPRQTIQLIYQRRSDYPFWRDAGVANVVATFSVRRDVRAGHILTFAWFPPLVLLIALQLWRRRPDFDQALVLAWKIDREAGYRAAGQSDWQFVKLSSLPGAPRRVFRQQRVELQRALDPEANLEPVALEPFPEGEIRVDSRLMMEVQGYDEPTSRQTSGEATIAQSTVVRAGRLLFAPLAPEVAEAVREGRVALPEPGGVAIDGRMSMVDGLRAHLARRRPGLWGWLFLAFGPPLLALAFALSGLVTNGFWVPILSIAIMLISVGPLQVLRRRVAAGLR